ncbi:DNA replication protein psf2 [Blastocladiella emersonii ATCC 22665]|nr:DNA replication protein psf2 [Blastocladiella emersonii ATCC 22665]
MAHLGTLTPAEIEFLAENEPITIEPLARLPEIELIRGPVGPFQPPRSATVPLWLALVLKKRGMCIVKPPAWMTVEHLTQKLTEEQTNDEFCSLPFHYMEVAKLILEGAKDDIPDVHAVQTLLQDLREARRSKTRSGVDVMGYSHIRVDNLSLMELNELRPTFTRAFQNIKRLQKAAVNAQRAPGVDASGEFDGFSSGMQSFGGSRP